MARSVHGGREDRGPAPEALPAGSHLRSRRADRIAYHPDSKHGQDDTEAIDNGERFAEESSTQPMASPNSGTRKLNTLARDSRVSCNTRHHNQ